MLTCAEAAGPRAILLSPWSVFCTYVQCVVTTVGNNVHTVLHGETQFKIDDPMDRSKIQIHLNGQ